MRPAQLTLRSLAHYWRSHLAVLSGVAIAVGVLTGSLIVGDSMRASLRSLFLSRLGRTDQLITRNGFFAEALVSDMAARVAAEQPTDSLMPPARAELVPIISLPGVVVGEATERRSSAVELYGVDGRFFEFHRIPEIAMSGRTVALTRALAVELRVAVGDTVLIRVDDPSEVSAASLFGRRDEQARTMRLEVISTGEDDGFLEFSISPSQAPRRAAFVPLDRLQRELSVSDGVNAILVASSASTKRLGQALHDSVSLEAMGVSVRELPDGQIVVESDAIMVNQALELAAEDAARDLELQVHKIFTYLANDMSVDGRSVPYSLVSGLSPEGFASLLPESESELTTTTPIVINDWAARELGASVGDELEMAFFLWEDQGRIIESSAEFEIVGTVSIAEPGLASDRDLSPTYPGISEADNLGDWDPPFPIDFRRITERDELYWDAYRATPKAFLPLDLAQALWPVRQGRLSSIRFEQGVSEPDASRPEIELAAVRRSLRARLSPLSQGFALTPVRALGVDASTGATDFGEYFVYFSYFLMMSGLLLTGLFFKLGLEQRREEIGTLAALGFSRSQIRRVFLMECSTVAVAGTALGVIVGVGYAALVLHGLTTVWVDAVGTTLLSLSITARSLGLGLGGGLVAAIATILLVLRAFRKLSPRELISGSSLVGDAAFDAGGRDRRRAFWIGLACVGGSLGLVWAAVDDRLSPVGGFFGAGNLMLIGALCLEWDWLKRRRTWKVKGRGLAGLFRLGFRNASYQPSRSLIAVALIAFAVFMIVSVDAFRKRAVIDVADKQGGAGGYSIVAESPIPVHWALDTEAGRDEVGLPQKNDEQGSFSITGFRLRPGEDASCLNLYRPQNPRIVGAPESFLQAGRFRFSSVVETASETESANPWLLLEAPMRDGVIPVIGDANSMQYVLHVGVGDVFELPVESAEPLKLRLVATLSDSLFQSELIVSERRFLEAFADRDGFQFFLVETEQQVEAVTTLLENRLQDWGVDAESSAARLAAFHRVENTYLSTFQTLGGLGLLLGTFGLGAILLRNVLERRSELALLRAVGFSSASFGILVYAENILILVMGLCTGVVAAGIAIAPAIVERGGELHVRSLAILLGLVVVSAFCASWFAARSAMALRLVETLREG